MTFLILIFAFYSSSALAAPEPSSFRYQVEIGASSTTYFEERNFGLNRPREHTQKGRYLLLGLTYFPIPTWLELAARINYTDGEFEQDHDGQLRFSEFKGQVKINLPPFFEKFAVTLTGEYYHLRNLKPYDEFSFESHHTFRFYPEFIFYPNGFETDFNYGLSFQKPLFHLNLRARELTIAAFLNFPLGGRSGNNYPLYAYQKILSIRLEYLQQEIYVNNSQGFNHYLIDSYRLALGLSF